MDSWSESIERSLAEDLWILESWAIVAVAAFEARVISPFHHEGGVHREVSAFAMADDGEWEETVFDDLGHVFFRELLGRDLLHGREVAVFFPTDKASIRATEDDISHRSVADEGHRHVLDAVIDAEMGFDMPDLQSGEAGALQDLEPELVVHGRIARAMGQEGFVREVSESFELDVFVSRR